MTEAKSNPLTPPLEPYLGRAHLPHETPLRRRAASRWRTGWADARVACLGGAFLWLSIGVVEFPGLGRALAFGVCGALHGLAVHSLMRLFPLRRFGLPFAGLLCGPVPVALLLSLGEKTEERGGVLVLAAGMGLLLGLLEAARAPQLGLPADG